MVCGMSSRRPSSRPAQLGYEVAARDEAGDVYCVSEKVVYYGNDLSFYLSTFFMSCL